MVVGVPDLVELEEITSSAEKELRMPIDITSFKVRGFLERIKVREALVSRALKGPKIMFIGEDSLANHSSIHYNS